MQRRHPLIPCLVATALALAGCTKAKNADSSASPGVANAAIKQALRAVPAEAGIVVSMSSPSTFWDMASGKDFIPMDPAISKELHSTLKAHIDEHLGLDFTELRSVVVFAGGEPIRGAAIFTPVRGTLRMGQDLEGGKLLDIDADEGIVAIHSGDTLIVGQSDAAMQGLAALSGKNKGMSGVFKELVDTQVKDAYVSATADVNMLPIPPNPITGGLEYGSMRLAGGKIAVTLKGKHETLTSMSEQLDAVMTLATLGLKKAMEDSKGDLAEGAAAIMGYYTTQNMAKLLTPKIKGETMQLEVDMSFGGGNSMIIVSVIGILAAVAIPAFMKYIKKSKTAEANMFLRKMSDGAKLAEIQNTLPATSIGPTPPLGSCCASPDGEKCSPDQGNWEDPAWQALDFAMRDPHYFSYEFVRAGDAYQVRAYGDLDCDGEYSTYTMASGDSGYVEQIDPLE